MRRDPVDEARRNAEGWPELAIVDLAGSVLGLIAPPLDGSAFYRLARPVGGPVDRARALYVLEATREAAAAGGSASWRAGWIDGPGVAADAGGSTDFPKTLEAVAAVLRALGEDERFACTYLELHPGTAANADGAASRAAAPSADLTEVP